MWHFSNNLWTHIRFDKETYTFIELHHIICDTSLYLKREKKIQALHRQRSSECKFPLSHTLASLSKMKRKKLLLVVYVEWWCLYSKYFEYSKRKIWPDVNSLPSTFLLLLCCSRQINDSNSGTKCTRLFSICIRLFVGELKYSPKKEWRKAI